MLNTQLQPFLILESTLPYHTNSALMYAYETHLLPI